jgi:hypothetical protein
MTAYFLHPAGIYFGTRGGDLYASSDDGKTWKKILEGLPPICCVKTAVVGEPRPDQASKVAPKPQGSRTKAKPTVRKKNERRSRR